jgi:hypothetical protein
MIFHTSLNAAFSEDWGTSTTGVTRPQFVLQNEEAVVIQVRSGRRDDKRQMKTLSLLLPFNLESFGFLFAS